MKRVRTAGTGRGEILWGNVSSDKALELDVQLHRHMDREAMRAMIRAHPDMARHVLGQRGVVRVGTVGDIPVSIT